MGEPGVECSGNALERPRIGILEGLDRIDDPGYGDLDDGRARGALPWNPDLLKGAEVAIHENHGRTKDGYQRKEARAPMDHLQIRYRRIVEVPRVWHVNVHLPVGPVQIDRRARIAVRITAVGNSLRRNQNAPAGSHGVISRPPRDPPDGLRIDVVRVDIEGGGLRAWVDLTRYPVNTRQHETSGE
jgi:hypothetical protein